MIGDACSRLVDVVDKVGVFPNYRDPDYRGIDDSGSSQGSLQREMEVHPDLNIQIIDRARLPTRLKYATHTAQPPASACVL